MNCKKLEFPIVKIPQNSNQLISYFNAKLNCIDNTKSNDIIDSTTDKIIKLNLNYDMKINTDPIYNSFKTQSNFYPVFTVEKKIGKTSIDMLIEPTNSNFDLYTSTCTLCKTTHNLGFKNSTRAFTLPIQTNLFGNYSPYLDDTNLIYRNFIVIFNPDPYVPDHLMLMAQNHDNLGVKGSQYEILNKEVLSDVIDVFIQISSEYIMGHNYALAGSQKHFHIHLFKKQPNVNYGMDNCIETLASDIDQYIIRHTIYNTTSFSRTITDNSDEIEYTCYINENNINTKIAEFKNKLFGYKGYVITIPKYIIDNDTKGDYKKNFVNVIFNFLNWIENSIEYSFCLYWPSSVNNFSVVVLVQSRTLKNKSLSIVAFRQITQFIFGSPTDSYETKVEHYKKLIDNTVKIGVFSKEDIWEVLLNKPASEGSIYGNSNLRQIIEIPTNNKSSNSFNLITNFTKFIVDKPSVLSPKIIIINSPIGSGKSLLFKNLKSYYTFYDEKTFVHANMDDLIMEIPGYQKLLKSTANFLKTKYLTKPFNTYSNRSLHKYGDKTIQSLKENNFMHELTLKNYETIYEEILNDRLEPTLETINNQHLKYFSQISFHREQLLKHILTVCIRNNFNLVLENARTNWGKLVQEFNSKITSFADNIYYLGNYFATNDFNKKFLLRNILIRNIEEGRVIDYKLATYSNYNEIITSYKDNILPENFILFNLGYFITPLKIKQAQVSNLKLTRDFNLVSSFNYSNCVDSKSASSTLKLNEINDESSTYRYLSGCVNTTKRINQPDTIKQKLKSLATDINNKYLLNENTTSLLIYNTIQNINSAIALSVSIHNNHSTNKITVDDIKLILKGGLNIRFLLREFFNVYEKYINLDQIQLLKSIIKSMDLSLDYANLFRNTTSKSDIDFTILIKFKR
jgi:hypothetical protein